MDILQKMGVCILIQNQREENGEPVGDVTAKGAGVDSHFDHRIAMSLAVAGLAAEGETIIEHPECIAISFPDFVATLSRIIKQ